MTTVEHLKEFVEARIDSRIKDMIFQGTITDNRWKHDKIILFYLGIDEDGNKQTHEFNFMPKANLQEWYAATHYDDDMDEDSRTKTRKTYPIEESFKDIYKQSFTINNVDYGHIWLTYNGDDIYEKKLKTIKS